MILNEMNAYRTAPIPFASDEDRPLSYGPAESMWPGPKCTDEDSFVVPQTESLSKDIYKIAVWLPSRVEEQRQSLGRMIRFNPYTNSGKLAFFFDAIEFESAEAQKEAPEDSQPIFRAVLRAANKFKRIEALARGKENTDPKDMRLIYAKLKELLVLIDTSSGTQPPVTEIPSEPATVLESFDGFVDSIDGDTAYVTLESRMNGEVLYGEYFASELLLKGIRERNRFLCETVTGADGGRVELSPVPRIKVTEEEARSIAAEMREAFPGDDYDVIEY